MLDIMTQAKNAIEAYNAALKVYSSNIASMSVSGYKRLDISFQSIFEKILQQGLASNTYEGVGGRNPIQLGQGSAIGGVQIDFSQGSFSSASLLDLAIAGLGLFIVSPDGGETKLYTRSGKFHLDADGNLLTMTGMQVYGYRLSGGVPAGDIEPININGLTTRRDLLTWTDDGILAEFPEAVDEHGNPLGKPDTTATPAVANQFYQIALTGFNNPSGLAQAQGTSFAETLASSSPWNPTIPGGAVGKVYPRQVEQSNVFYLTETINSMEIQRAMSGNLTILRMASDIISTFINRLS